MLRLISIILFGGISVLSHAQCSDFEWINPTPVGSQIEALDFVDENIGYGVGVRGTLIKTIDGGFSWQVLSFGEWKFYNFRDVWFRDENFGLACAEGNGLVLRTHDGGLTWEDISPDDDFSPWYEMHFVNDTLGYVGGSIADMWRTTNAGDSWEFINLPGNTVSDILFLNVDTGFVINSSNTILRTINGGENWNSASIPENGLRHLTAAGGKVFATTGLFGNAVSSVDFGLTWQDGPNAIGGDDIEFYNDTLGYGIRRSFNNIWVQKTTDGGETWETQVYLTGQNEIKDLEILSPTHLVMAGVAGSIMVSEDGGISWTQIREGFSNWFYRINFLENGRMFVGGGGLTAYSDDEGETWTEANVPHEEYIYGMSWLDNDRGFSCGGDGTAQKTTDGGDNWSAINPPGTLALWDIKFFDNEIGLVVGNSQYLRRTTNGGDSWSTTNYTSPETLYDMAIINDSTILAVGNDGLIIRSTDKGINWEVIETPYSGFIKSIHFRDELNGVFGGENEIIFFTSDGGLTWELIRDGFGDDIYGVQFSDAQNGAYCTLQFSGKVVTTSDGGATWQIQAVPSNTGLLDIARSPSGSWFAVGYYGKIVKIIGPPSAPALAADTLVFCEGELLEIAPSGTQLNWYLNEDDDFAFFDGPVYSPTVVSDTTFFVTQTVNACESAKAEIYIHFEPTPELPIAGSETETAVCEGGSFTFEIIPTTNAVWLSGETENTLLVQETGIYGVQNISPSGCASDTLLFSFTVNPVPAPPVLVANGELEICEGDSVLISIENPNFNSTYQWSNFTEESLTEIWVSETGPLNASETNEFGCTSNAASLVEITVYQNPPTPQIIMEPQNWLSTQTFASEWIWYWNGEIVQEGTQDYFEMLESGVYQVQAVINGCASEISEPFMADYVGIENIDSNSALKIVLDRTNRSARLNKTDGNYTVFASDGKVVSTGKIAAGKIILTDLSSGVYILVVENERIAFVW